MSFIKHIISFITERNVTDCNVLISLVKINCCSLFEHVFRLGLKNREELFVCHIFKQINSSH